MPDEPQKSFKDAASDKAPTLVQEIVEMLRHNKKYWLIPIILVLLAFGAFLVLGGTAAAPFIYTLF